MTRIFLITVLTLAMPFALFAEKVAFIGIVTASVDETLQEQLGLSNGLIVKIVEPNSPANDVLKKHDILIKLDDQLLINSPQLTALVKGKSAGDKVKIEFLRKGKTQHSEITLSEREASKPVASNATDLLGQMIIDLTHLGENGEASVHAFSSDSFDNIDGLKETLDEAFKQSGIRIEPLKNNGKSTSAGASISINGQDIDLSEMIDLESLTKGLNGLSGGNASIISSVGVLSSMNWSEDGVTFQMNTNEGESTLKITEGDKVVFDGPCNTDEDLKAIPEQYRESVDSVRKNSSITILKPERKAKIEKRKKAAASKSEEKDKDKK